MSQVDRSDDLPPTKADVAAPPPHREPDEHEEVYFHGSPLLRGEPGRVMLMGLIGLVLIATGIFFGTVYSSWPWWIILILIVAGLCFIALPILINHSIRYRITNYRIDYERGLLGRQIDTLELWHVEDIRFRQTLLDRMLGVGSIEVVSHDETTPHLDLRGIPHPRPVFEALKQRIIAVKRQRGVVKMDIG